MSEFRTIKGYTSRTDFNVSSAMEDYLEMICRFSREKGFIRIRQLASNLHVQPSSASKMAEHLKLAGFIEYEKYGYIRPSPSGWDMGNYLLHRHEVLNEFLCLLNNSSDELEQVEKIEHFFDRDTISNLEKLTARLKNPIDVSGADL
jgi:Mn-dependent DtxR family transcriptional regulator